MPRPAEVDLVSDFPGRRPPKIAMVVSRFPKVTETFQLREMVALGNLGVPFELYAITHHDDGGTVQAVRRASGWSMVQRKPNCAKRSVTA